MYCPMFRDFTRECIAPFKDVAEISTYITCQSDKYKTCPFYRSLTEQDKICKFMPKCRQIKLAFKMPFDVHTELANRYCFEDNRINCARYKLFEAGKEPPDNLIADGTIYEGE